MLVDPGRIYHHFIEFLFDREVHGVINPQYKLRLAYLACEFSSCLRVVA
jgi:hypothetical protein